MPTKRQLNLLREMEFEFPELRREDDPCYREPEEVFNRRIALENKGATFSSCRQYRYALWRVWDKSKPLVMFIGLNPSTANEHEPDPTIQTVSALSDNWGYGGFYMMNLFAIVSSEPKVLKTHPDPLGDNDGWIEMVATKCKDVVFAWGAFKEAKARCQKIIDQFPDALCIQILKDGSPKHPLYTPYKALPIKFKR
jgi:hypothetical protein